MTQPPSNYEPYPGEPPMETQLKIVRDMVREAHAAWTKSTSYPFARSATRSSNYIDSKDLEALLAGWLTGSWRSGWLVGNRHPRRNKIDEIISPDEAEALSLELGREYRIFVNPLRTSGVVCLREDCDGSATTDSLADVIAWIHSHEIVHHNGPA